MKTILLAFGGLILVGIYVALLPSIMFKLIEKWGDRKVQAQS